VADRPRTLGDSTAAAARRSRLDEPHVKPLNDLVREMLVLGRPAPWVDPDGAGVNARILFLAESPGPKAATAHGSGVVSVDNADPTAQRCWTLMRQTGLNFSDCVNWNAVPWYVSSERKNKNATVGDWKLAVDWFDAFLRRLPVLLVVVPMGRFAQDCWARYTAGPGAVRLPSLPCPHPSNLARVSNPNSEAEILEAMHGAKRLIADSR
jgi:uracil-DNA glycosylase